MSKKWPLKRLFKKPNVLKIILKSKNQNKQNDEDSFIKNKN